MAIDGVGLQISHASAAHRHLDEWVQTGRTPTGLAPGLQLSPEGTASSRRDALEEVLRTFRDTLRAELVPAGTADSPGNGRFAHIADLTQLGRIPMLHEVGEDVAVVLTDLVEIAGEITGADPYPAGLAVPAHPNLPRM